jgi:ribonucleoside-diphosphate reductase alpha chain
MPFAKSLIDYIFCWLGCQFIPGYADKNTPNRAAVPGAPENKTTTTARELVEKTKDLAKKIAEAKAGAKVNAEAIIKPKPDFSAPKHATNQSSPVLADRFTDDPANQIRALASSAVTQTSGPLQSEAKILEQFNAQFAHFPDDAPACDICGSITVRNGTCYRCYNCGNSMGCS